MGTDIRLVTKSYTRYIRQRFTYIYVEQPNRAVQAVLGEQNRTGWTKKQNKKKERNKLLACRNSCVLRTIAILRSFRAGRMTPLTSLVRMPSSSCILLSSIETSKFVFSPFCQVRPVQKQVGSRISRDDIFGYACGGRNRFTHPTHHDLQELHDLSTNR